MQKFFYKKTYLKDVSMNKCDNCNYICKDRIGYDNCNNCQYNGKKPIPREYEEEILYWYDGWGNAHYFATMPKGGYAWSWKDTLAVTLINVIMHGLWITGVIYYIYFS